MNAERDLLAVRLGLSQISDDNRPIVTEPTIKVPDLLVFRQQDLDPDERRLLTSTDFTTLGVRELDAAPQLPDLVRRAMCSIEVEFSPYRAAEMRGRNWNKKTAEELARRPRKRAEPPIAPNIWIKEEDLAPLTNWERRYRVPIIVSHLFDQEGFAIPLSVINAFATRLAAKPQCAIDLQLMSGIFAKEQIYDRQDAQGARERKNVYVVSPAAATKIGAVRNVEVTAQRGLSASKKYVAHVLFSGGAIALTSEYVSLLKSVRPQ